MSAGANGLPAGVRALPGRDRSGHKGTFGTVLVVGGCVGRAGTEAVTPRMVGGPALCALAAHRAGCGLVMLAMPEPLLNAGLTIATSATGLALPMNAAGDDVDASAAGVLERAMEGGTGVDVLAVGCGLGRSAGARELVRAALSQRRAAVVLDADGLNAVADEPELAAACRAAVVATPHVGELQRLGSAFGVQGEVEGAEADAGPAGELDARRRLATAVAQRLAGASGRSAAVVAKSSRTVVVGVGAGEEAASGERHAVHDDENPLLATGGTGDVLTGLIAGLVAQHWEGDNGGGDARGRSVFELAAAGVVAHSRAARAWGRGADRRTVQQGMLASDLAAALPGAVESLRAG